MGTNFYARIIPKKKDIDNTLKIIRNYLIGISLKIDTDPIYDMSEVIHLGKRSAGWQFLWQKNDKYYQDNLKSIKEFLSRKDIIIYDEYGDKFTVDELFNKELKDWLYNDNSHINLRQYYCKYPNEYEGQSLSNEYTTKDGLRFTTGYFS